MGGYIAYKWALTCPEQFAKAGGFAGSIDIVSVLHKHIGKGKPDFGHYLANSFVNGPEQNTKASGSRIRNTCRGTAGKWPNGNGHHTLYRKR